MSNHQIAIDGPSGAGKSTLARRLAARLGYLYLDTGAMYRAAGLKALRLGLEPGDEQAVKGIPCCTSIAFCAADGEQKILLDGEDVSQAIREHAVSMAASDISKHAPIRAWLVALQQEIAGAHDVVMDGRDIGLRVLPRAQWKFYVTADAQKRARWRCLELAQRGQEIPYEEVLADISRRDLQDSSRAVDPLRPTEDAVIVDTTDMNLDEAEAFLLQTIGEGL